MRISPIFSTNFKCSRLLHNARCSLHNSVSSTSSSPMMFGTVDFHKRQMMSQPIIAMAKVMLVIMKVTKCGKLLTKLIANCQVTSDHVKHFLQSLKHITTHN